MATVKTNKSPMHITCTVGQPYGNPSSSYTCGFHTGIDFPASGAGGGNPDLYSCVEDGEVVYVYNQSTGHEGNSLGNQVQIKDNKTGNYYRYCHMYPNTIEVSVGQKVTTATKLGKMGNTGNSTGTHLHLELSTTEAWQCASFLDPGPPIGIPNERGTVVEYDGSIEPPDPPDPPTPGKTKNSIKWLKSKSFNLSIKF